MFYVQDIILFARRMYSEVDPEALKDLGDGEVLRILHEHHDNAIQCALNMNMDGHTGLTKELLETMFDGATAQELIGEDGGEWSPEAVKGGVKRFEYALFFRELARAYESTYGAGTFKVKYNPGVAKKIVTMASYLASRGELPPEQCALPGIQALFAKHESHREMYDVYLHGDWKDLPPAEKNNILRKAADFRIEDTARILWLTWRSWNIHPHCLVWGLLTLRRYYREVKAPVVEIIMVEETPQEPNEVLDAEGDAVMRE